MVAASRQSLRFDPLGYVVVVEVITVNKFSPGARFVAGRANAEEVIVIDPLFDIAGVNVVTPGALIVTVLPEAIAL